MKIGIVFACTDNRRVGKKYNGAVQPVTDALIAALLPLTVDIEVINENSPHDLDWSQDFDLPFISSIHSDFDRARQISHYWHRRRAKTVYGGFMASTYPMLCAPYFDAIANSDAEGCFPELFRDFCDNELMPVYLSREYDSSLVPVPPFDMLADSNLLPLSRSILEPFRVTDSRGRVLPEWVESTSLYEHKGIISDGLKQLVATATGRA